MIIVVNHLTRMREGHICVAGVDLKTDQHVRPVLKWEQLTSQFLARNNGPFDLANVVDLGVTEPHPKKPHIEDRIFRPSQTRLLETLEAEDFWALLYSISKPSLQAIFGSDLRRVGRASCGTDVGKGEASLGCLRPSRRPQLKYTTRGRQGKPRIRIHLTDDRFDVWVGVTDIRLYENDHITPDRAIVEQTAQRLQKSGAVILGVGLTRPFSSSTEHENEPLHWLQVNNIHLEADPVRQRGPGESSRKSCGTKRRWWPFQSFN